MGYHGSDDRYGGDRWRDRDQGRASGGWDRDRDYGRGEYGRGADDRGFIDRAGDEVRSWFGDDEAQRRREIDQRRWEQEQRMSGRRDNDYGGGAGSLGGGGFGGGWGNQRGESWNRERPGERGWFSDSIGGERGDRRGGSGGGEPDQGRRFDRVDAGAPARFAATRDQQSGGRGGDYDPHYSEWRRRQIEDLDRDYDEYRREHQSKFEQEFGGWRQKRQSQRGLLNKVTEDMEVVGSDGQHIGTVDKVRGDRILLTKGDENAGGIHHSIPCGWVENVDEKVTVNRTADQAMQEWRDEERSRALFERDDQRGEGPHMLNRSFSGTYGDRSD